MIAQLPAWGRRHLARPPVRLLTDALGTATLNAASMALNFLIVLALSRALGVAGYGAYASAFAWAGIFSVVGVLGLTPLVIRETAAYRAAGSWGLVRGLLRRTNEAVAAAACSMVAVGAIAGLLIYHARPSLLHPYLAGLALVPVVALTAVRQAAMQGIGRVLAGRLPETVFVPACFLVLIVVMNAVLGERFTATVAISLAVAATCAGFVLGARLLRRALPATARTAAAEFETALWRRSVLPLLFLNVVMAANAQVGTIMLGAIGSAGDAGVFNVAFRVTIFISFVMLAATYPLGPAIALLNATGGRRDVEALAVRAARIVLLISVPVAAILVLFTTHVLALFGHGFEHGATAVRIMAFGDIINVLTGFGGLVLVMCGREGDLARSVAVGAVLNIGLAAVLIPLIGIDGAAIATASSTAASNLVMTWFAWRKLDIWAAVAGRRRR